MFPNLPLTKVSCILTKYSDADFKALYLANVIYYRFSICLTYRNKSLGTIEYDGGEDSKETSVG